MTVRRVSIIICTHNRSDLLPRIISQIRAQNYPQDAFELIVVNHRSTDNTQQVVEQIANEPGVILRYVYESHPGVTFARNRGAEEARYPYLAYIDDDCSVGPEWLPQLLSGFNLHERVLAVGGQVLPQWDEQRRPPWLGSELERWLAANAYLGSDSRILEKNEHIVEGNMALNREAWQAAGGFLGMEQFGSQNLAAGEVLYLLKQLYRQGGKIAFVPGALAYHHIGGWTYQRMLQRAYWQGVSDAILDYLLHRRNWASLVYRIHLDLAAFLILLGYATVFYLIKGRSKGMYHFTRAVRRWGLLLGEIHFVGDWYRARSWLLDHTIAG